MRGEALIRFRTLSPRRRRSLAAAGTVIAVGAATGIYLGTRDIYSSVARVEFVLGAGTGDAGKGPQLKVAGELQSMTTDRHGDVALFTRDDRGYELWMAAPDGIVKTVRIPAMDHFGESATDQAAQSAASPDGSFYLALDAAGLWRVTEDGHATHIIKTARGDLPDDAPVAQFSPLSVNGVTVTDDGTVFFSDTQETGAVLVHRLHSGEVTKGVEKLQRINSWPHRKVRTSWTPKSAAKRRASTSTSMQTRNHSRGTRETSSCTQARAY